jgi:hypothetical protein
MLAGGDVEFAFVGLLLHCDGADGSTTFTDVKGHTITAHYAASTLLLHCDGSDGSTTFTDVMGHSITANGNVQIDTAQSKFGGASALFDGAGDYLSTADSADWNYGSGNFTIELWYRFNIAPSGSFGVTTNNQWVYSQRVDGDNYVYIYAYGSAFAFDVWSSGSQVVRIQATSVTHDATTWHHLAVVRNGSTFTVYVDGTSKGTSTTASSLPDLAAALEFGRWSGDGAYFNGWMDDIRITKGFARYTANFTPPTEAFPDY